MCFGWLHDYLKGTLLAPSGPLRSKKFQKTLILALEVIVQPPKHTFEIDFLFRVFADCVCNAFHSTFLEILEQHCVKC